MLRRISISVASLLLLALACNLPRPSPTPDDFVFPTVNPLFPSVTPSATSPGLLDWLFPLPGPTATPTPRNWPPPYFGSPGPTQITPVPTPFPEIGDPADLNILLVGSDFRSGSSSYRTDVMIIVNIQPAHKLVTMISIPRDLYVYIPGWVMQRVNTAYTHGEVSGYPGGGPGLVKDTILYNLGVQIDFFAMIDFTGFIDIIETLDGVDVPIACAYTDWHIIDPDEDPEDEDNWELYTIGPGVVHMDGDLALWYARSRLRSSDFDRGRRQQELLRAIYAKSLRLGMLLRIPQLYSDIQETVTTDIGLDDLLALVPLAPKLRSPNVRSYFISGNLVESWRTPQGASVQLPVGPAIYAMLQEALGPPDPEEEQHIETLVEVLNGTTNPDWDELAAERLSYGGYEPQIAIAERRNYEETILYDLTAGQDLDAALSLLALLGLPSSALVSQPDPSGIIAYRLVLGADYNPCFRPANIQR